MVTINKATLRHDVWETIYDAIKAIDLLAASTSTSVQVLAAYPDNTTLNQPLLVVNPINVDKSEFTFNRGFSRKDLTIMFDVYTRKAEHLDLISDQLDVLADALAGSGLLVNGVTEATALGSPGDNKIHWKTVTWNIMRGD